jgi:ABC-type transporter Mla maintaining outer membrane lipid asymmetry ATPase subunit MlaF
VRNLFSIEPLFRSAVRLARALAAEPKILLLDEPAGGLNHEEVYVLGDLIRRIRDERHMTVLLVEHHMGLVMSIADHVVALNFGKKLAEGTPAQVQADPDVIKAYLTGPSDAQYQSRLYGRPRFTALGGGHPARQRRRQDHLRRSLRSTGNIEFEAR